MLIKLEEIEEIKKRSIYNFVYGIDVSIEGDRYKVTFCVMEKIDEIIVAMKWFYIYSKERLDELYKYIDNLQRQGVTILVDKHK